MVEAPFKWATTFTCRFLRICSTDFRIPHSRPLATLPPDGRRYRQQGADDPALAQDESIAGARRRQDSLDSKASAPLLAALTAEVFTWIIQGPGRELHAVEPRPESSSC